MNRLSKILVDWRNLQNGNVLSDFQTFQISEKKDLMFFFDLETRSIKRKKSENQLWEMLEKISDQVVRSYKNLVNHTSDLSKKKFS